VVVGGKYENLGGLRVLTQCIKCTPRGSGGMPHPPSLPKNEAEYTI